MADQDYGQNQGQRSRREQDYQGDWASQVRQQWQRGPYQDYGWEAGESVLPQFRDPSVHRTPYDEQEEERNRYGGQAGRRGPDFRRAYDYQNVRNMPAGDMPSQRGYGSGYDREPWKAPGPYTGRGPRGYQRSDERIHEDIAERLTRHGHIDARQMQVHVQNGEVTLTGTVNSRQEKRLAEDLADSVSGVKDVQNQLRLQGQGNNQDQASAQPQMNRQNNP